ncbi:hypothetical protein [Roseobacter sp. HKCCA0434]|uniref:hypothetical protein n=1 Tax=Roseobacter sp. HKCCA0434 TaxID=3079297 RepID=UPI002905A560|nr:hypothetical protein [Roseobacter sp. HKCCA0434]
MMRLALSLAALATLAGCVVPAGPIVSVAREAPTTAEGSFDVIARDGDGRIPAQCLATVSGRQVSLNAPADLGVDATEISALSCTALGQTLTVAERIPADVTRVGFIFDDRFSRIYLRRADGSIAAYQQ